MDNGIKVYTYIDADISERFFLSNGTEPMKINSYEKYYKNHIRKAKKPWRELLENELESLILNTFNCDYKSNIGIIKIPESIQELFDSIKVKEVKSYDDLNEIKSNNTINYLQAVDSLNEYFENYLFSNQKIHKIGFHIGMSDKEAATRNKNGTYTGFHVDYWDELKLSVIEKATNRICVNLGKNDRYFLFINLTLKQIYSKINVKDKKSFIKYDNQELLKAFFTLFPNYPVIKMKIKPYEGYIAPTENMIHDGSTEGNYSTDITLTTRGYFNIGIL